MVGLTHSVLGWSSSERLDGEYAFVAGLYVAALTAPALVLAVSRVIADAAVLYISLLVAVTGVTAVAGWIVSRTPGMAVTLGRHDAVWLLVVLPFGWFGGVIGGAALGVEPPAIAAPLAVIGTAGGMLLGITLVAMSRTRHANAALKDAIELVEWDARWPRRWRRIAGGISIVAFTASTLGKGIRYTLRAPGSIRCRSSAPYNQSSCSSPRPRLSNIPARTVYHHHMSWVDWSSWCSIQPIPSLANRCIGAVPSRVLEFHN